GFAVHRSQSPKPPEREDPKYKVPSRDTVGNHSSVSELISVPGWIGSDQWSPTRSMYQMSMLGSDLPGAGRFEMKKNRLPSEAMNGSASRYFPEKLANTGLLQCPFDKWLT